MLLFFSQLKLSNKLHLLFFSLEFFSIGEKEIALAPQPKKKRFSNVHCSVFSDEACPFRQMPNFNKSNNQHM